MSRDSPTVYVYPTEDQLERWDQRKDEVSVSSRSRFVIDMVEAGIKVDKGFTATVDRDETARELRRQRNDLKVELDRARDRIEDLEGQLYGGEREAIKNLVFDSPGAAYEDIVRHVTETVPQRVSRHLEDMEGETVRVDSDTGDYYPTEEDHAESDR